MANKMTSIGNGNMSIPVTGDIIGGIVLALLGLTHLFVLELGGTIGGVLLFIIWPFFSGVIGAVIDHQKHPGRARDLPLVGAVTGVFGAGITVVVVLLTGWLGVWSGFIFDTFGVELASVTLSLAMLFALAWTVSSFVGAYTVREGLKRS